MERGYSIEEGKVYWFSAEMKKRAVRVPKIAATGKYIFPVMIDCAPGKNRDFEVLCHGDYMDVMRRWQDFAKNAFSASAPAASVGPGGGAAEEKDASETRLFMFEIDPSETAILNAAIAKMDQEALRSLVFSNPFVASENPQRPAKRRLEAVMEARA